MLVGKLHFEYGVRQSLDYRTLKFYNVILRQKNPSYRVSLVDLGEDDHSIVGDRNRVLIVSGERAVGGNYCPFVI